MLFGEAPALDWTALFGVARPVEIEIGSGKGAFVLAEARAHPERSYLALEVQRRWVRMMEERLEHARLDNVRAFCVDARIVIEIFTPAASVAAYHVYFPDPWWKRRHAKRRLLTPAFADALHRTLEPGGTLWIATDVAERFEWMLDAVATQPFAVERLDSRTPGQALTNFEAKYRREGRPLHYARAIKR